eukprot:m51a1_g12096 hypothetical protein (205) ;mRNA; f:197-963
MCPSCFSFSSSADVCGNFSSCSLCDSRCQPAASSCAVSTVKETGSKALLVAIIVPTVLVVALLIVAAVIAVLVVSRISRRRNRQPQQEEHNVVVAPRPDTIVVVEPRSLEFSLKVGEKSTQQLTFQSTEERTISIRAPAATAALTVAVNPFGQVHAGVETSQMITVWLLQPPKASVGAINTAITIINSTDGEELVVPLKVTLKD